MMRVLIVEDDENIGRILEMELNHEGFETFRESDGKRALEKMLKEEFDVALLDLMLPSMNGVTVCKEVRKESDIPIIMLTAKDDTVDKVTGLDAGADDYVTKPFVMEELLARIRVAIRKNKKKNENEEKIGIRNLTLYPARFETVINGENILLTKKEYMLLEYLVRNQNKVLNREQILENVWGYNYMGDINVVDVYVRYLRAKIDDAYGEKYIHTIRGIGYVVK
ncbi:MAG: response regulator transcription factor [Selenomonadaceae bacterium]|nr:response regulator transcription factor [Selenomonadaceae bacterium]